LEGCGPACAVGALADLDAPRVPDVDAEPLPSPSSRLGTGSRAAVDRIASSDEGTHPSAAWIFRTRNRPFARSTRTLSSNTLRPWTRPTRRYLPTTNACFAIRRGSRSSFVPRAAANLNRPKKRHCGASCHTVTRTVAGRARWKRDTAREVVERLLARCAAGAALTDAEDDPLAELLPVGGKKAAAGGGVPVPLTACGGVSTGGGVGRVCKGGAVVVGGGVTVTGGTVAIGVVMGGVVMGGVVIGGVVIGGVVIGGVVIGGVVTGVDTVGIVTAGRPGGVSLVAAGADAEMNRTATASAARASARLTTGKRRRPQMVAGSWMG
jgi:hypothetical protein